MAEASDQRRAIRFGVFELDLEAGELRKNGVRIKLQEQPFHVLALLLEHPGEIVTREEIIKQLWPDGTFVEFDRSLNIAVNKIREALGDSASSPRFVETVPRRGYRFVAPVEVVGKPRASPSAASSSLGSRNPTVPWSWLAGLVFLAVVGYGVWSLVRPGRVPPEPPIEVPLTSYPGLELHPDFSPDGNDIVFSWKRSEDTGYDIYRQQIGLGDPVRLTQDPADDLSPVWSPDGQRIAFQRSIGQDRAAVIVMPALSGPERVIGEVYRQKMSPGEFWYRRLAWSPDQEWIAVPDRSALGAPFVIQLLSPDTRERRPLTAPPPRCNGDTGPAFAPDASALVFCRRTGTYGASHLFLQNLSEDLELVGEPRRLAPNHEQMGNPSWTADGKEIVFISRREGLRELWITAASGRGEPQRLPLGQDAELPTVSPRGSRLAYVRLRRSTSIWSLRIPPPGESAGAPTQHQASSTRMEWFPRYSPDGSKIALQSNRSGRYQIWTCDADGSQLQQITFFQRNLTGSPSWSPDGRQIAFDSTADQGQSEIYKVSADGGRPIRLTHNSSPDFRPAWSADSEWIYFESNRGPSGKYHVWRIPSDGGDAHQITKSGSQLPGGFYGALRPGDEKWFYYSSSGSLMRVPSDGGEESVVVESAFGSGSWVVERGIYFLRAADNGTFSLHFYRFATSDTRFVAELGADVTNGGISVSPDQRTFLFVRQMPTEADLMLVESFR